MYKHAYKAFGEWSEDDFCLCCDKQQPFTKPRRCPACNKQFDHNWCGINTHWDRCHSHIMPYMDFFRTMCPWHKGLKHLPIGKGPIRARLANKPKITLGERLVASNQTSSKDLDHYRWKTVYKVCRCDICEREIQRFEHYIRYTTTRDGRYGHTRICEYCVSLSASCQETFDTGFLEPNDIWPTAVELELVTPVGQWFQTKHGIIPQRKPIKISKPKAPLTVEAKAEPKVETKVEEKPKPEPETNTEVEYDDEPDQEMQHIGLSVFAG